MDINYNPFSLEGKIILITGASSGIGRETAVSCSKMGATVIVTGRDKERLQETFNDLVGENHIQILADLTTEEGLCSLISMMSHLDGVVLCAGKGLTLPLQFATREKFNDIFEINFFAPVELLRLLFTKKLLNKQASVVFVSSIGGNGSYNLGNGIYGASKSALNSIMKYAAREFAQRKIRVNSICPGMTETPFIHRGTLTDDDFSNDMDKYPLKRYGTPSDIANGILFLLSDASSWMTGQSLVIDGGYTL
jgi:NAD(P)-dependent dehydrogenase (short-subunit alcohol dehydrogenase family)